ncbi:MAG: hypothetical protein JNK87_07910 [Bryobacterales bacterium]|nr:hypothetical protein [Bryobacterales bacterium]
MKPRNKEVNIFNMSLLDILCGALGAFCFLMLVLFQYWKPDGPNITKSKENSAQLEKQVDELLKKMATMSNLSPEAAANLRRMQQQFEKLQAETRQLRNELQRAQGQAQAYQRQAKQAEAQVAEQKKEINKLKGRNPITIMMGTDTPQQEVDLYVADPKMPAPDATKVQGRHWRGDVLLNLKTGSDVWMMRDAPPQEYKVYYKFMAKKTNTAARVWGYYMHNDKLLPLPDIELPTDRRAYYVGSILVRPDYGSVFRAAPEHLPRYIETLKGLKLTPETVVAPAQN